MFSQGHRIGRAGNRARSWQLEAGGSPLVLRLDCVRESHREVERSLLQCETGRNALLPLFALMRPLRTTIASLVRDACAGCLA